MSKLLLLTEMSWADAWGYVLRRSDEDWRLVLMYSGDPDQGGDGGRQTLSKLWHSLFTWPDSMANTPQHQRVALTDHINNTRISSVSQIPTTRTHPGINKIQTNISKARQKRPQWCIGWALWVFCNHLLVDWGQTLGKIWNSPGGGDKSSAQRSARPSSHLSWAQHIKCRALNITWPNLTPSQKC